MTGALGRLDEAWVEASGAALAAGGAWGAATGVVAVEVGGADGGAYWREWAGGVPVGGGVGKPDGPADLTLGLTEAEARAFWRGEWRADVAFMRGQLKTAGDNALLLTLLAAAARPSAVAAIAAVAALGGAGAFGGPGGSTSPG